MDLLDQWELLLVNCKEVNRTDIIGNFLVSTDVNVLPEDWAHNSEVLLSLNHADILLVYYLLWTSLEVFLN